MKRLDRVSNAAEQWAHDLTDMSGRNRLLYHKHRKSSTLSLADADTSGLKRLLLEKPGAEVLLSELFTDAATSTSAASAGTAHANSTNPTSADSTNSTHTDGTNPALSDSFAEALKKARSVARKAVINYEERGLRTLFLVRGVATWISDTSQSTPAAPVLMCPATLRRLGASETDYYVSIDGEWTLNEALLQILSQRFGVKTNNEDILGAYLDDARLDNTEVSAIYADLNAQASDVHGFHIDETQLFLDNFMYRKMSMVSEIQNNLEALAEHDIIAAMAGDTQAFEALNSKRAHKLDPAQPDYTTPADEYLILDADSSQNATINAAVAGESFVLQGPPGTGKSQTIANLIATMMARGKNVLFVAEKRAAIEAVSKRLKSVGLDQFVLDLHGGVMSRRETARHIDSTLTTISRTLPTDNTEIHTELMRSRSELSGYNTELHKKRQPWDVSYFDTLFHASLSTAHTQTAEHTQTASSLQATATVNPTFSASVKPMFSAAVIKSLGKTEATDTRRRLQDWADLASPILSKQSPWARAVVIDTDEVRSILRTIDDIKELLPMAHKVQSELLADLGLRLDALGSLDSSDTPGSSDNNPRSTFTTQNYRQLLNLLRSVAVTHSKFGPEIFELNLDELAHHLAPAERGVLSMFKAKITDSNYRAAQRQLSAMWRRSDEPLNPSDALQHTQSACEQLNTWHTLGVSGSPRPYMKLAEATDAQDKLESAVMTLSSLTRNKTLLQLHPHELIKTVKAMSDDVRTLHRLPKLHELEEQLKASKVGELLELVKSGDLAQTDVVEVFNKAWLRSIRREILLEVPLLATFDGQQQTRNVEDFQRYDAAHLRYSAARVRRRIAEYVVAACNDHTDQSNLIRRESAKKTRHLPLRDLLARAPDVLKAVQPCWAMSPLDVAHTLPVQQSFDLVVFDEASQVLPSDAVPALLRAPQAIVVGDSRQLPPTAFFDDDRNSTHGQISSTHGQNDGDETVHDDEIGSLSIFESILDVLDSILNRRTLTWHYRSQDERLIAYSNRNFYHGTLTTFPSASVGMCPRFELVEHEPGAPVDTRSNPAEVIRVVDLMIEHARQHPEMSLGVIAMGMYHANRIEETLRKRLREEQDTALERFFDDNAEERTFVKNLERVQGDERDSIILSIGYGKNAAGQVVYRFGPLNTEGGERRMNVAITRARKEMTLVSSFSHIEMAPERLNAAGAQHLYGYLKYAESGELGGTHNDVPLNVFELDVMDKLEKHGLSMVPQYGQSGFRIDFAVRHPHIHNRFVLAVEADGASYHSSHTARDRDRLRQEHLERLGWRFCRIWSTDWFNNHSHEVAKVVTAYEKAVNEADASTLPDGGLTLSQTELSPPLSSTKMERTPPEGTPLKEPLTPPEPEGATADEPLSPTELSPPEPKLKAVGQAPVFEEGIPIHKHPYEKLVELAEWIMSDGFLRTDDQIFEEMFKHLKYNKRGSRIRETLFKAIKSAKNNIP